MISYKILYTWLKDLGFENEQLYLEYSFKINLGKYTYKVNSSSEDKQEVAYPRTDILVQNSSGKNLLIIEVKKPNHTLNNKDKLQAISYARLLSQIAPFTILTNGNETIIYDSVTTEQLKEQYIPNTHPYVQNGFKVTTPDLEFYNNALEVFIGLSKENLLTFCNIQVQKSMNLLKSDDILSGKKYIPSLYIKRENQEDALLQLLNKEDNKLVFVTGSPQHGKTSFICNFVENLLRENKPCIFYPAISIQNSLLDELQSDFEWMLSLNSSIYNIMTRKIQDILEKTNSRLFIVLDGLNETGLEFISTLNNDFSRLKNLKITFILSFTSLTARRLFTDGVNNTTELADYLSLSIRDLEALEIDSQNVNEKIITIPPYSENEAGDAIAKYAEVYDVKVQSSELYYDPFLLRIIMSYYKNKTFNGSVDEIELLEHYIKEKISRTKDLDELIIEYILECISKDIFLNESPLPLKNILKFTTSENIESLFESALLSKTYKNNKKYLEFYNEREQCYFISLMARNWQEQFTTIDTFTSEANNALKTNVGKLALSWYIKVNPNSIKNFTDKLFLSDLYDLQSIVLYSLREYLYKKSDVDFDWIYQIIEKTIFSKNKKVITESFKLIPLIFKYKDHVPSDLDIDLFINVIFNDKESDNTSDALDMINYETLKFLHHEEGAGYIEDSTITISLKKFIIKEQNQKALEALAFCAPFVLIIFLDEESDNLKNLVNKTPSLIDHMQTELDYHYFDYMGCPGFFDNADQEELINEYIGCFDYYSSFLKIYTNKGLLSHFESLLETIYTYLNKRSIVLLTKDGYLDFDHPNQTYFDFENL